MDAHDQKTQQQESCGTADRRGSKSNQQQLITVVITHNN